MKTLRELSNKLTTWLHYTHIDHVLSALLIVVFFYPFGYVWVGCWAAALYYYGREVRQNEEKKKTGFTYIAQHGSPVKAFKLWLQLMNPLTYDRDGQLDLYPVWIVCGILGAVDFYIPTLFVALL